MVNVSNVPLRLHVSYDCETWYMHCMNMFIVPSSLITAHMMLCSGSYRARCLLERYFHLKVIFRQGAL